MPQISLLFLIIAFFLQLKALEYRETVSSVGAFCSIGAWVSLGVGLITWFTV